MHGGTIRALEFDRIVEAVRSFALTPLGAAALNGLVPHTDPRTVKTALAATSEGVSYLEANAPFGLEGPPDLDRILQSLAVAGRPLEAPQLVGLANFLASVSAVRAAIKSANGGPFPSLRTVIDGARSFEREVSDIRAKIDSEGEVVDNATPELGAIRERLRKQRNRLRSTLESYLRGRETAKYLQEQVVSERGGRFVLVIRSEHRGSIPGIVHGSSGSGASLFIEPLSTVEINNDIVALEEDEAHEVRRILLGLADGLRKRALDLRHTLAAATEIDVIQARARFSRLIDGVEPALNADERIELPQARHPLLIPAVRARTSESKPDADTERTGPVPVDILVTPPTGALIVTGPNTGGKTVALKTTGLLVLMAQAGLHVPTGDDAKVAVFRSVFADIGDEQSIANSLSTFSGHIANIVAMDRHLALPALLLLDEVGAGTDPVEGGALGAAVIEHFRRRHALVVATTHDDMLKSYASTTDGVSCAGFGFDPKTFAPTYQLVYGSPGRSLALEIASRLGVASTIIEDARQRRSAREGQLADHLAKVEQDLRKLDQERAAVISQRDRLDRDRARLAEAQQALAERETAARQRLTSGVDDELRAARREVEEIVNGLRTRVAELTRAAARDAAGQPRLSTGDTGALKRQAVDALEAVDARTRTAEHAAVAEPHRSPAPATPATNSAPPGVGSHVVIDSLRLEGQVVAAHEREVEVDVRGKRLHVAIRDVRMVAHATGGSGGVTVDVSPGSEPPGELNVIGCRVDDALSRVEKYMDQAMLHERRALRVIHGYGTGQLRRAIAGFLGQHPLVATFELAAPEQGGGGVTIIELKD